MGTYTLLALGPAHPDTDRAWLESPHIDRIFRQHSTAPMGKRLGSRVLGIGLDSLLLAIRTLRPTLRGPYLANNPWIGAALRLTGRRDFVVTGIYAEPASRSWRVLRRLIGGAPVITLSQSEVGPWNEAGGTATAVLYGNTFRYPAKRAVEQKLRIFVGGSSDRDPQTIRALEEEVLLSREPVELVLATGEGLSENVSGNNVVKRLGHLSQSDFGALLSTASVTFLPLRDGTRAAGHMVMVGSLESGIPIAVTSSRGMSEYVFGQAVIACNRDQPILPQLRMLAESTLGQEESIRQFWRDTFSLNAYIARVGSILETLSEGADRR